MNDLWTAIGLEATYRCVLEKAEARDLPPLDRIPFWVMLVSRKDRPLTTSKIGLLLSLGRELKELVEFSIAHNMI